MRIETPVLFCIFNRPEVTHRTFAAIARQQPRHLLIASDGPREGVANDARQVWLTREVVNRIDWDCNYQAVFQNSNLGCRQHMARAISWGFEQHERLIVLEDDCLPHGDFFPYCEELLDKYSENSNVMSISGIGNLEPPVSVDYRFSKYPLIWGWASWRRAWQHYDLEMPAWHSERNQAQVLDNFTETPQERSYWKRIFDAQSQGKINTWDYSWTFASWLNNGLTILPRVNLVSNIGFGNSATHTTDSSSPMANRETFPLTLQSHPETITRDVEWDRLADQFFFPKSLEPNGNEDFIEKLSANRKNRLPFLSRFRKKAA